MPTVDTEAMNLHLKEIGKCVAPNPHVAVTLDGAGRHQQGSRLKVPGNLSLLPLPSYSPEPNPQENIREYLRANKLCSPIPNSYEAIVDACKAAWNFLIDDPSRIRSIGQRQWACAKSGLVGMTRRSRCIVRLRVEKGGRTPSDWPLAGWPDNETPRPRRRARAPLRLASDLGPGGRYPRRSGIARRHHGTRVLHRRQSL